MIVRLLIWALGWLLIGTALRRWLRKKRDPERGGPRSAGGGRRAVSRYGGVMVRDRICDTYVARERAIEHRDPDGSRHYFCSEACRRRFLEGAA